MINIQIPSKPYDFTKPHVYRRQIIATGKYYIGKHNGYLGKRYNGSGKLWKIDYASYVIDPNIDVIVEILEYVDDLTKLNEREMYWLNLVDAKNNPNYYNLTNRSCGVDKLTEEQRLKISIGNKGLIKGPKSNVIKEKISISNKITKNKPEYISKLVKRLTGHLVSEETRQKISKTNKGKIVSKEICDKISKSKIGYIYKLEHKEKISKANKGKIRSQEFKDKISISKIGKGIKSIIQYDLNMNPIKEWSSIKEASNTLNLDGGTITNCCKGKKTKTCGGYKWKYKED